MVIFKNQLVWIHTDVHNITRFFPHGTLSLLVKHNIIKYNPSFIKKHTLNELYTNAEKILNINNNSVLNRKQFNSIVNWDCNLYNFLINLNNANVENNINILQLAMQDLTTETLHGVYLDLIEENVNLYRHIINTLGHIPRINLMNNLNY